MTEQMKAKRDSLKELSKLIAVRVEEGEYATINEGLVDMYTAQGHTEIHSFKQWLSLGKVVRKGEKALLLWGEPVNSNKQEKQEGKDDEDFKFVPLAYVFSQLQVEPLMKKTA